jgi:hypothetical protein
MLICFILKPLLKQYVTERKKQLRIAECRAGSPRLLMLKQKELERAVATVNPKAAVRERIKPVAAERSTHGRGN